MVKQAEPRRTEYMPLDDVLRAPRNPKLHDEKLISASFKRFGVVELPALDERTGRLVAGHGRLNEWERSRAEGDDPPDGVITDDQGGWLVPVNRGWASRSDADAEAYLIVSNRSTELGGWNEAELQMVLQDLRDAELLDVTGYTEDDIDGLNDVTGGGMDTADALADTEDHYSEQYGCIVLADDEAEQERTYKALLDMGYRVKVVTT